MGDGVVLAAAGTASRASRLMPSIVHSLRARPSRLPARCASAVRVGNAMRVIQTESWMAAASNVVLDDFMRGSPSRLILALAAANDSFSAASTAQPRFTSLNGPTILNV